MISTRGRYALRVMLDIAERETDGYVPLNQIAERQGMPIKYLEIILKSLVANGLLKGHRGKGGGYRLTRPPEEYTVGEVLGLTENSLAPVACLNPGAPPCPRSGSCRTLPMWKRFDAMTHDFFFGMTLKDLIEEGTVKGE